MKINPEYVQDLDFGDDMRPGIFVGARSLRPMHTHVCQLCGFEAHNPAYFTLINGAGIQMSKQEMPTDELMVTRMQDQFAFLKECSREEIARLKRTYQL